MEEVVIPLVAILSIFVVLPGMAMYYADRKRTRQHERETVGQRANDEMLALADRMEKRIEALERILDAEAPGWRARHHG